MTNAMEICALGMVNDLQQLNIIGYNLANANTAGYKRDIAVTRSFESLFNGELSPIVSASDRFQPFDSVPRVSRMADHAPGALKFSGNPLDVVIEGDGFFELGSGPGALYTRHGAFSLDAAGRLVNAHGMVVRGEEGEILLNTTEVIIDQEGNIFEENEYAGRLKLVRFDDPSSLTKSSGGMWIAPAGITARPIEGRQLRQGYVESSNVAVLDEMVRMLTSLRHFEMTANVIKGYDEMIGTAVSTIPEL